MKDHIIVFILLALAGMLNTYEVMTTGLDVIVWTSLLGVIWVTFSVAKTITLRSILNWQWMLIHFLYFFVMTGIFNLFHCCYVWTHM